MPRNVKPEGAGKRHSGEFQTSLDSQEYSSSAAAGQPVWPSDKRGWALWYADLGRVFQIRPNGTKPAVKDNLKRATSDKALIREWWTDPLTGESTDHNIGFVCDGGENGVTVVDLDPKNSPDVIAQFEMMLDVWNADHPTLVVDTPNGGRHYYYRTAELIGTGAYTNKFLKGLDTRGAGTGYVIGAGSTRTIKTGPGKNDEEVRAYTIRSTGCSDE